MAPRRLSGRFCRDRCGSRTAARRWKRLRSTNVQTHQHRPNKRFKHLARIEWRIRFLLLVDRAPAKFKSAIAARSKGERGQRYRELNNVECKICRIVRR